MQKSALAYITVYLVRSLFSWQFITLRCVKDLTRWTEAPRRDVPVGRAAAVFREEAEESPGFTEKRWRLTAAGGDPRESATENRPPFGSPRGKGETVRQERTALPAMAAAGQTPPEAKPNRDDARGNPQASPALSSGLVARDASQAASQRNGRHVPPQGGAIQNPAYRPTGNNFSSPARQTPAWPPGSAAARYWQHQARQ
jgi:hypothetical protein